MYHYRSASGVSSSLVAGVHEWAPALAADLKLRTVPRIRFVEAAPGPGRDVLSSWRWAVNGWFQPFKTISRSVVYLRVDVDEASMIHCLAEELRHHCQYERDQFPRNLPGALPADHPLEVDARRYAYGAICPRVLRRPTCRHCNEVFT